MKRLLIGLLLALAGHACRAGDITGASTYFGPIQGVGVGFFGHVGIGLPPGQTCHGKTVVVLLTTNARYKDILSVLLVAEAGKQSVRMYRLGAVMTTFAESYSYCTITEASLGDFPMWTD